MPSVEMIEKLGTAAPIVSEGSTEQAGCVALAGHSDGNIEIVARPTVSAVVKQGLTLPSVPRANLPLEVRARVVREHLTEVQAALLQAVLEVAGLGTPGLILIRAVSAVVSEITDLRVKTTVMSAGLDWASPYTEVRRPD